MSGAQDSPFQQLQMPSRPIPHLPSAQASGSDNHYPFQQQQQQQCASPPMQMMMVPNSGAILKNDQKNTRKSDDGPQPIACASYGRSMMISVIGSKHYAHGKLNEEGEEHIEKEIAACRVDRIMGRDIMRGYKSVAEKMHRSGGGGKNVEEFCHFNMTCVCRYVAGDNKKGGEDDDQEEEDKKLKPEDD